MVSKSEIIIIKINLYVSYEILTKFDVSRIERPNFFELSIDNPLGYGHKV